MSTSAQAESRTTSTGTAPAGAPAAGGGAGAFSAAAVTLRERILGWLSFRAFLWLKLPLAGFAGLRVRALERGLCEVTVPFGWRSQNPFGSLYFAAHAMAAEMTTGALCLLHVADQADGRVSTLITDLEAKYVKAAKALTTYRCEDGEAIAAAVRRTVETGEPATVTVRSVGTCGGEIVAEFKLIWSLKRRDARK